MCILEPPHYCNILEKHLSPRDQSFMDNGETGFREIMNYVEKSQIIGLYEDHTTCSRMGCSIVGGYILWLDIGIPFMLNYTCTAQSSNKQEGRE